MGGGERIVWRALQVLVGLVGAGMIAALFLDPGLGLHAFWNVLIPVAPALLVVSTGLWRNICPLGSTAMLARHVGLSRRIHIGRRVQDLLGPVGIALLLLIVPLRHFILDLSGPSTAIVLLIMGAAAFAAGLLFDSKSAWCSGICPVHQVELLYGQEPLYSPPNAHCGTCTRCVVVCPEATPAVHPLAVNGTRLGGLAGTLLVGGFVGYIWGWFQVADYGFVAWGPEAATQLLQSYAWPLGSMLVSCALYLLLLRGLGTQRRRMLDRSFAAAAVACYYWFRLPALFGFGPHPGDGMLVDLTGSLPTWSVGVGRALTTVLFAYLLVGRQARARSWTSRPPFAERT